MIGYKRISLLIEKALKLSANTGDKVLNYGEGNLYPQNLSELIYASKTGSAAVVFLRQVWLQTVFTCRNSP